MKNITEFILEAKETIQSKLDKESKQFMDEYTDKIQKILLQQYKNIKVEQVKQQSNGDNPQFFSFNLLVADNKIAITTPIVCAKKFGWVKDLYNKIKDPCILIFVYDENGDTDVEYNDCIAINIKTHQLFTCNSYTNNAKALGRISYTTNHYTVSTKIEKSKKLNDAIECAQLLSENL